MSGKQFFEKNPELKTYLSHYYHLLQQENVALYLQCKKIPLEFDFQASDENLWKIHNEIFHISNSTRITENSEAKQSLLNLKIELANRMLKNCTMCENQCEVNRYSKERGFCGLDDTPLISTSFLHHGEEPPLVPSGTIFFQGCSFDCCFCQNFSLSRIGKKSDPHLEIPYASVTMDFLQPYYKEEGFIPNHLAQISENLGKKGALNINYVGGDPTPSLATIISSMKYQTRNICQLWNSNFYNSIPALDLLIDVIDLWLPDFKYGNNQCGFKYSAIQNYYDVITRNLKYIYKFGSKSIIIRHLVMPNHLECCTFPIFEFIVKEIPNVVVNIMPQYHPAYKVDDETYSEINRKVSKTEMMQVIEWAN